MGLLNKLLSGFIIVAVTGLSSHAAFAADNITTDTNTNANTDTVVTSTLEDLVTLDDAEIEAELEKTTADQVETDRVQAIIDDVAARITALKAKKLADKKLAIIQAAELAAKQLAAKILAAKKAEELEAKNNPLNASYVPNPVFIAYADFPQINFNPIKPINNPLAVYKLRNIAHTLPLIDATTRLHTQKLSSGNSIIKGLKIWKAEQKAVKRHLILNNYKLLWFKNHQLDVQKASEIIATIKNSKNFALRPEAYKLDELQQLMLQATTYIKPQWLTIPGTKQQLKMLQKDEQLNRIALIHAKLDLALTHAALTYSRHASSGRLIPSAVDRNNDIHPIATPASLVLNHLKLLNKQGDLQAWLEAQNPQTRQFKALLAEYKVQSTGIEVKVKNIVVPAGKALKPGHKSDRVVKLAMRLEQLGFYDNSLETEYPRQYNQTVIASVKAFQANQGLQADGIAGSQTLSALNFKQPDYLKTLLVNIERQRWMPDNMGAKHVLVNQAEFRLRVFEKGKITHTSRVIIGKNVHQTPIFNDKISTVVVNPYWNIPASIIYNEMRNKIADASYMSRNNYQILGDVSWAKATSRYVPFRMRQKPGAGNALGRVKFLFPNRHSIYMHDTPSKSLFSRASRAFSHGCVRVQNPNLLALNLMGWSQEKFDNMVATGKNQHYALKQKIPVYLSYMTATVDKDGVMRYFNDVYNRDDKVANALGVKQILAELADNRKSELAMVLSSK